MFELLTGTASETEERSDAHQEKKIKVTKKKHFIDGDLVTKLDALGLSDYQAVRVISAVAQALGFSIDDLVLSRSTIRRVRKENREKVAKQIKETFTVNFKKI